MSSLKTSWRKLFFFQGATPLLVGVVASLGLSSWLGLQVPGLSASLPQSYSHQEDYLKALKMLGALFIAIYFNRSFYQILVSRYIMGLIQKVRSLCYDDWVWARNSQETQDRFPQGEVMARIMADTEAIRELITSGTVGILIDFFFIVSCLLGLAKLNTFIGPSLALTEFVLCAFLIWGAKYMKGAFLAVRQSRAKVSRVLANLVGGLGQAFFLRHESYAVNLGSKVSDDFLEKQLKANIWDAGYYSFAESLYPVLLALAVIIIPWSGVKEMAIIFATVDLIQRSIDPIKDITGKISGLQRAMTGLQRVESFLSALAPLRTSKAIDFSETDNSTFSVSIPHFEYKKRNEQEESFSLKDIKLEARSGELIGLVGSSGCGKSTVFSLLAGLLPWSSGLMSYVGPDGKGYAFNRDNGEDYGKLSGLVGLVSQDSHIFTDTLAFNISLGLKSVKEVEVFWKDACKRLPYLRQWGIGPSDIIGPKDLGLGQTQLLAALRACFLGRPIVLFDEISSGMDSHLEKSLRNMILWIQQHSVTITVTHRLETVKEANRVYFMDNGQIICSGPYDNLISSNSDFKEFVKELRTSTT